MRCLAPVITACTMHFVLHICSQFRVCMSCLKKTKNKVLGCLNWPQGILNVQRLSALDPVLFIWEVPGSHGWWTRDFSRPENMKLTSTRVHLPNINSLDLQYIRLFKYNLLSNLNGCKIFRKGNCTRGVEPPVSSCQCILFPNKYAIMDYSLNITLGFIGCIVLHCRKCLCPKHVSFIWNSHFKP